MKADSHCFYRAFSKKFLGTQEHHEKLRIRLA